MTYTNNSYTENLVTIDSTQHVLTAPPMQNMVTEYNICIHTQAKIYMYMYVHMGVCVFIPATA